MKYIFCGLWLLYFISYVALSSAAGTAYEEISDNGALTEADLEYMSRLLQRAVKNRQSSNQVKPIVIVDPNGKPLTQIRSRLRLPIIGKREETRLRLPIIGRRTEGTRLRLPIIGKRQGFKPCVFKYCDF